MPSYTSQGIVYSILIARVAIQDLDEIASVHPEASDTIWALLEEVKANQSLLDSLTSHDYGAYKTEAYHVSVWGTQHAQGRNLWRLKIWELEELGEQYRVVYCLDPRFSRYYVLGVFHRDFNYDESDPRTLRVLASYDRIGVPDYR